MLLRRNTRFAQGETAAPGPVPPPRAPAPAVPIAADRQL